MCRAVHTGNGSTCSTTPRALQVLRNDEYTQRNYSGWRIRYSLVPDHTRCVETTAPHLRQANDLLPAQRVDAGGHPQYPGDLYTARHSAFRAIARGWVCLGNVLPI